MKLGLSGRLTQATIRSPLTPLFLLAALAVGLLALLTIPREEEPQISVPLVDIRVNADGLKAPDAVEMVTKPLEAIVKGIDGVEHVYSQTVDDRVMVTARFKVGTNADDAILRVHEKIRANIERIPVGIPEPLIVGRGINDVAVVVLTLSPKPQAAARYNDKDLYQLAQQLQFELVKTDNIGLTYISGGNAQQIRVEPDPEKLALYGVTLQQLVGKVREANRSFQAGAVRDNGTMRDVAAGQTLSGIPDIGLLLVTTRDNRPVYVRDVAKVVIGPSPREHRVWMDTPEKGGHWDRVPAVSVAFAKRAGANAVVVAEDLLARLHTVEGRLVPHDVNVTVTRDYGETANDKANELLFHLGLATVSIVVLIAFAIGWREALVTLVVIPTTILLTLFAAKLMGYTINRVSLFALIFAIGILVDDAIVVVENIARHWAMKDGRSRLQGAVEAVAEVGNPTVVATLTVVAALLPMLFVSGLMGPYMAPIPANASAAMLFSFFVAMVIAPWLMLKLHPEGKPVHEHEAAHGEGMLGRLYRRFASPIVRTRKNAWRFLISVGVATLAVCVLFYTKSVTVKLLPFDNKSEMSVVIDLPEGATLEDTERTLFSIADVARQLPEIRSIETYAGTPAPFNFNGLVRHYYIREAPELGELHSIWRRAASAAAASHAIALDLRARLKKVALPRRHGGARGGGAARSAGAVDAAGRSLRAGFKDAARDVADELKKIFASVPYIVDVDDSIGQPRPRLRISIDQDRLEFFGVEQSDVYDTIQALFGGTTVGYSHRGEGRNPIEIVVRLPKRSLSWSDALASTPVPANVVPGSKKVVELGDVVRVTKEVGSPTIFRRDGHFADMVMGELAGAYEAPIYGILAVDKQGRRARLGQARHADRALPRPAGRRGQADDPVGRRMGDHLRDLPRHGRRLHGGDRRHLHSGGGAIRQLQIAAGDPHADPAHADRHRARPLAVRRAVHRHLDDRLHRARRHHRAQLDPAGGFHPPWRPAQGKTLREVLLEAGAVRFKPILLTALAAMIGAATILLDPIFQGLAISLLFGLASSTLLTVLVIPAIYVVLRDPDRIARRQSGPQ